MSKEVDAWKGQIVSLITADGRNYVGVLEDVDHAMNISLQYSHERIYSPDSPVQQVPQGEILIRGDNVVCIGPIDEDKDLAIDFETARGVALPKLRY